MKKSLFIVLFFLSAAIIAGFFAISQRRTHPADAGFANHEKGGGSEMPERDDVARKDWGYDFSLKKIFLEGEEQEYGIEKGNVFKDGQILEAGSPERERVLRLFINGWRRVHCFFIRKWKPGRWKIRSGGWKRSMAN